MWIHIIFLVVISLKLVIWQNIYPSNWCGDNSSTGCSNDHFGFLIFIHNYSGAHRRQRSLLGSKLIVGRPWQSEKVLEIWKREIVHHTIVYYPRLWWCHAVSKARRKSFINFVKISRQLGLTKGLWNLWQKQRPHSDRWLRCERFHGRLYRNIQLRSVLDLDTFCCLIFSFLWLQHILLKSDLSIAEKCYCQIQQ